jgi:threonine dehydrogenase-like Zn-dependent dehydrogenase
VTSGTETVGVETLGTVTPGTVTVGVETVGIVVTSGTVTLGVDVVPGGRMASGVRRFCEGGLRTGESRRVLLAVVATG